MAINATRRISSRLRKRKARYQDPLRRWRLRKRA